MIRSLRRQVALALAIAAAAGIAQPAPVAAQGDTSAIAINTHDGASLFRLAFQIRQVTADVVDQTNAAVAYSSCEACRTVAISIQVLLVSASVTTFTPTNMAIAINENCTLCDSLALAYQFAIGGSTRLKLTSAGRREVAAIRRELESLRGQNLTDPEIDVRVRALMLRLSGVLHTQLIGRDERADHEDRATRPHERKDEAPPATDGQPPASGTASPTGAQPGTTTPAEHTITPSGPTAAPDDPTAVPGDTTATPGDTTTTPGDTTTTPGDTTTTPGDTPTTQRTAPADPVPSGAPPAGTTPAP